MTTIAYRDGIIAYDGRSTQGDVIIRDDKNKAIRKEGRIFIGFGGVPGIIKIIDTYLDGNIDLPIDANIIVIEKDKTMFQVGVDPDSDPVDCWSNPLDKKIHYAWGSGSLHAMTAMDMGATAKEAVKMAMKRDVYTGGKIRSIKI